jgi:hypothetical protein
VSKNPLKACPVCATLFFVKVAVLAAEGGEGTIARPTYQCANCRAIVEPQDDGELMVVTRIR